MPMIGGSYSMNRAYGRALERRLQEDASREAQHAAEKALTRRDDLRTSGRPLDGPGVWEGIPSVESGAQLFFTLETRVPLAQGRGRVKAALVNAQGKEVASEDKLDVDVNAEHVAVRIGAGPTGPGSVQGLRVRLWPIEPNSDFGTTGRARVRFTITDASGKQGTAEVPVWVEAPKTVDTGHRLWKIQRGKSTFDVP